jgi:flagellar basal-body rod modification protein FlgD
MSTVNPATATTATPATSGAAASNPSLNVNETQFLQLMITQLQYQDPLSPSDPSQFTAQLAQFTSVEQETNTANHTQQGMYLSLLGHTVTYSAADGTVGTGVVQKVDLTANGGATLTVNGTGGINASTVTEVSQ